ncbi:hypothetical protein F4859DRAFT_481119 [Xylaria cf. heliscus]|nr:hypothetical protein F4859DRAFT_481119 [Xylaria cf. heliscus]
MTEGLKKAAGRIQGHIAKLPDRAVHIDEQGQRVIREKQPPRTMDDLRNMLPTVKIDDIWTKEEEQSFRGKCITAPYYQYIQSDRSIPPGGNNNYWTMWKCIPRLRNCFPTDIVGAKCHLKYGVDIDIGSGIMKPDLRWSSGFCERLTELSLGSPCGANMGLLALLIRYTVADRLDDRRQVSLDDHRTGNRFFGDLGSRIKRENSFRSLRDIHADIRQDWENAGEYVPWESDVMFSIEQLNNSVRSPQPTMPTPGEDFPEYGVETADLTRLIRACDQTGDLGYANLSTVEQRAAFIAHGRTKQDPLQHKNRDELNSLRIPLLEDEERFKARRVLMSQRRDEPDPGFDSNGSGSGSNLSRDAGLDLEGSREREPEDDNIPIVNRDYGMDDDYSMPFPDPDDGWRADNEPRESEPRGDSSSGRDGDGRDSIFLGFGSGVPREGSLGSGQNQPGGLETDTSDNDDPREEYPQQCVSRKDREMVPWDEEDAVGYRLLNPADASVNEPLEVLSLAQPLNLPETSLATAKHPALAVGSSDLGKSLAANAANVLSDLGYVGRLH